MCSRVITLPGLPLHPPTHFPETQAWRWDGATHLLGDPTEVRSVNLGRFDFLKRTLVNQIQWTLIFFLFRFINKYIDNINIHNILNDKMLCSQKSMDVLLKYSH